MGYSLCACCCARTYCFLTLAALGLLGLLMSREYMFNLIVDNLEEALSQVSQGGADIVGEVREQQFGRLGWFLDPEGNKVELWEPNDA